MISSFLQGADLDAADRAAVGSGSSDVAIHEPPRQVSGVGHLQGRVRETLARSYVETKYSSTVRRSLKLWMTGDSMISPSPPVIFFCGFAISPRIPARSLADLLLRSAACPGAPS